ncbi:MAG: lysophospholipid acyltransferase family protein [Myxococcota bacterium]|nr:lysophospholipid acyltransferase family protein [Myxococcota bacterium]
MPSEHPSLGDNALLLNIAHVTARLLREYHQHSVSGLETFPIQGPTLLVFNHSFASYDMMLLAATVYEYCQRIMRPLGDRMIFKTPGFSSIATRLGAVEGSMENALPLLKSGALVAVAPGGMREALRPSSKKYQLCWEHRTGFARLSMVSGAKIVLAACPKADDLYTLYENWLTKTVYKNFRTPLPVSRGFGPSFVPRPIKLTHYLSPPFTPPKASTQTFEEELTQYHASLVGQMEKLMNIDSSESQ